MSDLVEKFYHKIFYKKKQKLKLTFQHTIGQMVRQQYNKTKTIKQIHGYVGIISSNSSLDQTKTKSHKKMRHPV
jgi:hypothetical protein